jgi:hypothetical protein
MMLTHSLRVFVPWIAAVLLLAACGNTDGLGSDTATPESTIVAESSVADVVSTTVDQNESAEPADWQVMILSDSLAVGGWADLWGDLITRDRGVSVDVLNYWRPGYADYAVMLQQNLIRTEIAKPAVIFIHPEADVIRTGCELGDIACVQETTDAYADEWDGFLDEIQALNPEVIIRSAKAWEWLVPPEGVEGLTGPNGREGLLAFMDAMAAVTEAHGGKVVDLNAVIGALDPDLRIPDDWIGADGHFNATGAVVVAEALHELGYDD